MKYYNITVNGVAYSVSVEETAAGAAPVAAPAAPAAPKAPAAPAAAPKAAAPAGAAGAVTVKAPMPATSWMSRSQPVLPSRPVTCWSSSRP